MRLTEKENTNEILRFGNPQRVTSGIGPATHTRYFGADHENSEGGGHHLPLGSTWVDIWGTTWRKEHEGVMGFPRGNPLENLVEDLQSYQFPDSDDSRLVGQIYSMAQGHDGSTTFLVGSHRDTLWEKSYMLCGMENMMCNFYAEPEATKELLHRIMNFQLGIARHYLAVGVEVVDCGDDLGTQNALLLSPEIVHEFLVPEYRRLYSLYKAHGVIINFHSCGHITPLLETFIDLGIDVLNPLQTTANDLAEVRRITQGRLTLAGGLSSGVLVEGPPSLIRAEVQRLIWLLGRDGGYFCGPDQGMPWPEVHWHAYNEALEEFGCYPLQADEPDSEHEPLRDRQG